MLKYEPSPRRHTGDNIRPHPWLKPALLGGLGLTLLTTIGSIGWVAVRANQLQPVAAQLVQQSNTLREQVALGDASAAAATLALMRETSATAEGMTSGPAWALTAHLPVVGKNVRAAQALTSSAADLTQATQPFEAALPQLSSTKGGVNLDALRRVTAALPGLSATADDSLDRLRDIDINGVNPQLAQGVNQLRELLTQAQQPLHTSASTMQVFANLLGAAGPRNYVVLLQQDAEARGTGGLVGAYTVLNAQDGALKLADSGPRGQLGAGAKIPLSAVPQPLQDLWGSDLREWAGLNLSPHFPWTGNLVAAGWKEQKRPPIDGVIAIDQYAVAGLLGATGPVSVDGLTLTKENAVSVLSKDVYAQFPDYRRVDAVTGDLVQAMFAKVASGEVSPTAMVRALAEPVAQRRVLVWSSRPSEQQIIEATPLGGVIPDGPGPFLMAVVNNGGGNKLDAYLRTTVSYDPGACTDGVRIGSGAITLTSTAPADGLPAYVTGTPDGKPVPTPVTRVLLDIYGPVGASQAGIQLDGQDTPVIADGTDRNHPVWRISVPLAPGQTRTVTVGLAHPTTDGDTPEAVVPVQPMVIPASVTTTRPPVCP